jgi:hypothetical protein
MVNNFVRSKFREAFGLTAQECFNDLLAFAIDSFDLHDTRVMATYLDGREVCAAKAKWSSRCGRRTR